MTPERRPGLAVASLAVMAVAAVWAVAAVVAFDGAHDYISDGFCFKGEPEWRYVQAAIAAVGVLVSLVAAALALRAASGYRRFPARWFVSAAVLLIMWVVVVAFFVGPFSFVDGPTPLPAVECTY